MFDIKNIVNRIRDRGRESNPDSPAHGREEESDRHPAEGFLCPSCMVKFASQEALSSHYETTHGDLLDNNKQQNDRHFQTLHEEIGEKCNRQDAIDSAKTNHDAEVQAVTSVTDSTELKEKLIQTLKSKFLLETEKDRLEQKAANLAKINAAMKAAADEAESSQSTVKERLKVLEAQLAHRESIDDAAVLKQELVQVQRMMDELTREKEKERDMLQKELQNLQDKYNQLEQRSSDSSSHTKEVDALNGKLLSKEDECCRLQKQLENCKLQVETAAEKAVNLNSELAEYKDKLKKFQEENEELKHSLKNKDQSFSEIIELKQRSIDESIAQLKKMKEKLEDKDKAYDEVKSKLENIIDEESKTKSALTEMKQHVESQEFEIKSRDSRIEELNSALKKSKDTIAKQESERAELVAKIQAGEGTKTVIQQLTQETTTLQERIKLFEKKEEEKNRNIKDLKLQIQNIKSKYENCIKELEVKECELKTMETSLSNMSGNVSDLQKSLEEKETQIEELSSFVERFRLNWGNMETELDDLKLTVNVKFQEISELKELNTELMVRKKEAQEKLEIQESELQRMQCEIKELGSKLNEHQSSLQLKDTEISEQTNKIQTLTAEKQLLTETVENLQRTVHSNEEFIQAIGVQRTSLETDLFELQKSMAELETEKKNGEESLKMEIATLGSSLKSALSASESTKMELEQVKRHNAKLLEDYGTLQREKDLQEAELVTECQKLSSEIEVETSEKNNLMSSLTTAERKISEMTNEIDTIKRSLNIAEQTHSEKLAALQNTLDEISGEKLAIEAQLEASQTEHKVLLERFIATNGEMENLRHTILELRRKLDESQAALQELGRENQTLQLDLEKLTGRKWTEDSDAVQCGQCRKDFNVIVRKHHCRNCGQIFCNECSSKLAPVGNNKKPVRVCDNCYNEIMNK